MNNKILNLALAISQVMRSFLIFILVVVVIMGIVLIVDTEALPFLSYQGGSFSFSNNEAQNGAGEVRPERWFMVFAFLKLAFTILCSILILNEALKIIQSIRSLDTFKKENIIAFRRMASLFFVLFVLHIFYLKENGDALAFTFSLPLDYLFAVIGCFILAEIFKEGNRLMEENELTI